MNYVVVRRSVVDSTYVVTAHDRVEAANFVRDLMEAGEPVDEHVTRTTIRSVRALPER